MIIPPAEFPHDAEDDARAVAFDEAVGGTTEPSPPEMLYVLYG
jgi:hypothetical protein